MLRFACPGCGAPLSAPPDCAGRASRCRSCGSVVVVPFPVAVSRRNASHREIRAMTPSHRPEQVKTVPWAAASPTVPAAMPAELADHPRYRLAEVLGEGGMGTVYKAEHRLMKRWVALKVVRHALLEQPAVRERFFREVHTSARLTHPNIVVTHDAEQAGHLCFLVMEYVNGEDLAALVRRRGPLPVAEACRYVREAALGLQHAHENGLVHRDIKPGNLMLTAEGRVKVLDFGLARFTLEKAADQAPPDVAPAPAVALDGQTVSQVPQHTATGSLLGTPAYMAPEQLRDARNADIRADIYSLGCTLVHLLTGQPAPAKRAERRPDLPPALSAVLGRMVAAAPADRYQTPAEVAAALAPFAGIDPPAAKRFLSRRWLLLGLAAAILIVSVPAYFLIDAIGRKPAASARNDRTDGVKRGGKNALVPPGIDPRAATKIHNLVATPSVTLGGTSVQVKLRVVALPPNIGDPEGEVTIRARKKEPGSDQPKGGAGETTLGTAKVRDGQATVTITAPEAGQYLLTAVYGGDEAYAPCTSEPITFRAGIGAIQQFTVTGAPTGMITLTFNGTTTTPMRCNTSAAQVQSALNQLASVAGVDGQVTVSKAGNVYTVTFLGGLSAKQVPQITAVGNNGAQVTTLTIREGKSPNPNR
jgi:tRNA A-37 threonylcarbamoyl transferase component Bud32